MTMFQFPMALWFAGSNPSAAVSVRFSSIGVALVFASTIREAVLDIAKRDRSFALCQDALRDGGYEDLLRIRDAFGSSLPLIVISRTGDWPDYFRAIDQGAYDFLAYPLIPGELQRIIRNLLGDPFLLLLG